MKPDRLYGQKPKPAKLGTPKCEHRKHRPPRLRVQSPPESLCRSNERGEAPAAPLLFARSTWLHRLLPAWRPGPLPARVFLFHPSLKLDRLPRKCPDSLESSGQVLL